jgi:N-acetyl-anhydromuramyl-L-alanine amidase AmpD
MITKLSTIYKKTKVPRLLQATFIAVAAFFVAGAAPIAVHATSLSTPLPFMGDNPSGKTKSDGSPLKPLLKQLAPSAPKKNTDTFQAECPKEIKCVVMPAAYAMNGSDPGNYGNYDKANRPHDMDISSIVIHDTEGSLASVEQAFQDPTFYASSHYVIDTDGTVYQFVPDKDVAWHAGNWTTNEHSIGIEHVGYAAQGSTGYTPEMYRSSAALVKWLSAKYDIPRDRQHIIGHDNVQAPNPSLVTSMHVDPGPFWNWQNYMALIGTSAFSQNTMSHNWDWHNKSVTVAPTWPLSKQPVTGCWPTDNCAPSTPLPTNFVYLRTEPNVDAPLISDTVLGQGTTDLGNAAAKAFYGQTFAVQDAKFERDGVWFKIWFSGQSGWFYSPWNAPSALPASSKFATPKGNDSVPIYGRPLPEKTDYPADFTPPAGAVTYPTPLPYMIGTGQRYQVMGAPVRADHFYAWTIDSSQDKYDHTVFKGKQWYVPVQYNNRFGYVKLSDVTIK